MFVVERQALLTALAAVDALGGGAPSASLCAEDDGTLVVSAGTAERGGRAVTLASRTLLPGSVNVPLTSTRQLLKRSNGSRCELGSNGKASVLAIDGEGPTARKYVFPSADLTDAPDRPPTDPGATVCEITTPALVALLARTAFCTTRPAAGGGSWSTDAVRLSIDAGKLTASCTDCYRFATASAPVAAEAKAHATLLVKETVLKDWLRAIRGTETVKLFLGARLTLRAGGFAGWVAPHGGPFPDASALPDDWPHSISVPTVAFSSAVKGAMALLDRDDPRLVLSIRRGGVTVSAMQADGAKCDSNIPAPGSDGPALAVTLHGGRLLGCLKAYADQPSVTLKYRGERQPVMLCVPDASTVLCPHVERDESPKRGKRVGQAS